MQKFIYLKVKEQGELTIKSYTLGLDESQDFLNSFTYDKERNVIVLNYASGKVLPANCTRENLIKILEKMKYQVLNSSQFENKQKNKFRLALIMCSLAGLMLILSAFIPNPSFLLLITSILTLYISSNVMVTTQKMLDDIKKNKLFLEHSDEINKAVKNLTTDEISNMIRNTSLKDTTIEDDKILYMETEDIPILNLNSIDELSLKETEDLIKTFSIKPKKK